MTPKKSRRSLNDSLATEFVFGAQQEASEPTEIMDEPLDASEPLVKPHKTEKNSNLKKSRLMDKLMDSPEKEPVVRFTVDMAESMHRKLSILAAKTGKKKAEIVRMLLQEALEDVDI